MTPIRLAKFIAMAGICSRKQASRLIDQGQVRVNHRPANHIDHVTLDDEVSVAGKVIQSLPKKRLFAYHKPVGIDCKLKPDDPNSLIHQLPSDVRLFPLGRLDKDSRGLLLLSNDGDLSHQLMHSDTHVSKTYLITTFKPFEDDLLTFLSQGVPLKEGATRPCHTKRVSPTQFEIVLTQGWKRQIRRMVKAGGHHVKDLLRKQIGAYQLGDLPAGSMLEIDPEDVAPRAFALSTV